MKSEETHCLVYSSDSLLMGANCHSLMGGTCSEVTWSMNTSLFNTFSSLNLHFRGFHVAFPMWPVGPSVPAKVPWLGEDQDLHIDCAELVLELQQRQNFSGLQESNSLNTDGKPP